MSTAAERLREQAERIKAEQLKRHTTVPDADPGQADEAAASASTPKKPARRSGSSTTAAGAPAPKSTPIRSTVDLPPARHHALKEWSRDAAVELGKTRVTTQEVVRTLVARLLTDETLSRKIMADMRNEVI